MVLVVDFPTAHVVADSIVLIVDASLACAGAGILVIVVDALMAQLWAVLTALEVDAPQARAGADWMCLVLMVDAPMTCLLYTSPSPRDLSTSRMPSSA